MKTNDLFIVYRNLHEQFDGENVSIRKRRQKSIVSKMVRLVLFLKTIIFSDFKNSLVRGCLHGGGPAFLVGLDLPRGLDFMGKISWFTWEKLALLSHETRNPIFAYKFSAFYILHINKRSLWNKKLSKKCWSRQPLSKEISTMTVTLYLIKLIDVRKNTNEHRILYKWT